MSTIAAELEAAVGDVESGLAVLDVAHQEWERSTLAHTQLAFEFGDRAWTVVEQALAKFAAEKCASEGIVYLRDADAMLRFGKRIAHSMNLFYGDFFAYKYFWNYDQRIIEMRRGGRGTDNFIRNARTLIRELEVMTPPPQTELLSANDQDPPPKVVLAPKGKDAPEYTLALDLDDTLVVTDRNERLDAAFSISDKCSEYEKTPRVWWVRVRPHCRTFLERVSKCFEVCIFTHGERAYADAVLDQLDPGRALISHRLYREHCSAGEQRKDLRILGRDLARTVAIDDTPEWFGLQAQNCLPIKSWNRGNWHDRELLKLAPFLEALAAQRSLIHWRTGINVAYAHAKFELLGTGGPEEAAAAVWSERSFGGGQQTAESRSAEEELDAIVGDEQQGLAALEAARQRSEQTRKQFDALTCTYAHKIHTIVAQALDQFAREKCDGMVLNNGAGMGMYTFDARIGKLLYKQQQQLGTTEAEDSGGKRMHFREGLLQYMSHKECEYHCYTEEARRIVQLLEQVPALDAQQLQALLAKEEDY